MPNKTKETPLEQFHNGAMDGFMLVAIIQITPNRPALEEAMAKKIAANELNL